MLMLRQKLRKSETVVSSLSREWNNCAYTDGCGYFADYPYTIQNWPCTNDAAQEALELLKDTHRVIPIPAYEVEGGLMYPQYYRRQLQGALVEIHFTLSHWSIAAKPDQRHENTDMYLVEVYSIRVLRPPLPRKLDQQVCSHPFITKNSNNFRFY